LEWSAWTKWSPDTQGRAYCQAAKREFNIGNSSLEGMCITGCARKGRMSRPREPSTSECGAVGQQSGWKNGH